MDLAVLCGFHFAEDRPWVEFEILERNFEEEEVRRKDAEVEKSFNGGAPSEDSLTKTGTVMTEYGFEVPVFDLNL